MTMLKLKDWIAEPKYVKRSFDRGVDTIAFETRSAAGPGLGEYRYTMFSLFAFKI